MEFSRKAIEALLALVSASEGAAVQRVSGQDGREYLVPDVVLYSDQGIYRPNGAQLPFRRGQNSYVLVRRVAIAPHRLRMVLVDERFRCSSATLAHLRAEPDRPGSRQARLCAHHRRAGGRSAGALYVRASTRAPPGSGLLGSRRYDRREHALRGAAGGARPR